MDAVSWVDAKYIHLHTKVYGFVTAYEERMCYWSCPLNRKFNGNEVFVCWAHTINSARTLRIQNIQANRKRKKNRSLWSIECERAFLRLFFSMCWVRLYHNSGNNIRPSAHTVPAIERKHSAIQRVRMLSLRSMDDTTDFPQNTHTFTPVIRVHTHFRMSCTPILWHLFSIPRETHLSGWQAKAFSSSTYSRNRIRKTFRVYSSVRLEHGWLADVCRYSGTDSLKF